MSLSAETTGGFGVLETLLSQLRARKAASLLRSVGQRHSVLDIGCGTRGLLLSSVDFDRKVGIDRRNITPPRTVHFVGADIASSPALPFGNESFDAVTMLAVIEHVDPQRAPNIVAEVRRVLRVAGMFVLTTPAGWTDPLLRAMARVRLLSPREIDEHAYAYTPDGLTSLLKRGGFDERGIRTGHFEMRVNLWATATRMA